jgi:chromosome segregation protein
MRIRSLEITGFKSFADRVALGFDRGISAIVGPNGCGKSNVVDAIRWVMGEQNPRHLRGRGMDDVIFNGTEGRAAIGLSEVVLTLDAGDGRAPAGYAGFTEIQIARRLYRSGESEYLINKVPCRLRDVLDFFLDTGIGTRGYTIVEQGQIASIVSTRPQDRRFIIEEAAGIGKYRQRRRETERKLEATQQNLLRVSDVTAELRRQIGSLDRQARKAARYKELSARLRDVELAVAREELDGHAARVDGQRREFEEARAASTAADARQARAEAALETERRAHLERERELQGSSERLYALRSEIQSLESRIEYQGRERSGLLELADQREAEAAELEAQLAENREALREAVEQLSFHERRVTEEQERLDGRSAELRGRSNELAQLQGEREALQARIADLTTEAATLESRLQALEDRRGEIERRLRAEEERLEADAARVEDLRREEGELTNRRRDALEEQDELGRSLAGRIRDHEERRHALDTRREELAEASAALERSAARLESLREAERSETEAAARTLEQLPPVERRAVRGLLLEAVRVEEGLEAALESALGARLHAVVVDAPGSALALLRHLRGARTGRLSVLVSSGEEMAPSSGFVPLGRPLLESVTAKPPFEPLVRRLLRDVYVVDDLAQAVERFGAAEPPAAFVTPSGEIFDRAGALTGGAPAPGAIGRASEIRGLEPEVEALRERRAALEAEVARLGEETDELEREIENTRSRRHTAELALVQFEKDLERARERAKTADEAAADHRSGKAALLEERERIDAERDAASRRLEEIGEERTRATQAREGLTARVSEQSRELERFEQRVVQQRVELAQLGARRDQLQAARDQHQRSLDEAGDWLSRRRSEVSGARERAAELERSTAEAERGLAEQIRQEERVRAGQGSVRAAWEEVQRRVEQLETEARTAGRDRESVRERLSSLELALQEAGLRREQLLERIRERHSVDLERYRPDPELLEGDSASREAEVARLRQSLEAIGPVHLGAIEEYEQVSERYRYVTEQKADLELSLERLRSAIARINKTSRARFRETFEAVDREFQNLFPRLFRGGRAHLSLTESDDVLEAGIEISAQPPGKKLQNVNLLSGGEKSLTAIALLFAVFAVKPSPFFLLDEVDAALDDANVTRFNELVAEMAANSQFLLITHNKGTIEIAQKLFGITMQEPGLSKLVTVDLVA